MRLDDGGEYRASELQEWLYGECWLDYWTKVDDARKRAGNAHLAVVLNGDAFEGDHHKTMQIISRNPEAAAYIADSVFGEIRKRRPFYKLVIRGTAVHEGGSGYSAEGLGKDWANRDPDTGTWSSFERRFQIHGVDFHAKHHGRMGRLPWTRHGILSRVAVEVELEFYRSGEEPPDIAIRSHNHKYGDTYHAGPVRVLATPCFQAKTEYAHKVSESLADIGGFIITVTPDGEYDVEHVEYQMLLPTMEVLT